MTKITSNYFEIEVGKTTANVKLLGTLTVDIKKLDEFITGFHELMTFDCNMKFEDITLNLFKYDKLYLKAHLNNDTVKVDEAENKIGLMYELLVKNNQIERLGVNAYDILQCHGFFDH